MAQSRSENVTRGEVNQIITDFAVKDPKYREALLRNPKDVLERQMGMQLPGSVKVKVVEETADTIFLVAPHVPRKGELSDADLEKVAGGALKIQENQNRYQCTVIAGNGTRTEINIG